MLDIPGESRDAGVVAGLWNWNGGGHQRAFFEFEPSGTGEDDARIRMSHSSLYLRAAGERVVQDQALASPESQYWELVDIEEDPVDIAGKRQGSDVVRMLLGDNRITVSNTSDRGYTIVIADLRGRVIRKERLKRNEVTFISDLPRGAYCLSLHGGGRIENHRVYIR